MRRTELVSSIRKILNDLDESGVRALFHSTTEKYRNASERENLFKALSFEPFQRFSILSDRYSAEELKVLRILELGNLTSPEWWAVILRDADVSAFFDMNWNINFAFDQLPKIVELIKQEDVEEVRSGLEDAPARLKGFSLLEVIMIEDRGEYSSPTRAITLLQSITDLYTVESYLADNSGDDLILLACDSGSDKTFTFIGIEKSIDALRKLLSDIWARRTFGQKLQMEANLDLVSRSLPILGEIEDRTAEGAISPEQGEILKRLVLEGATKFLQSGAVTPEMDMDSIPNPRALMRPAQKLLSGPPQGMTVSGGEVGAADDQSHDKESEREELERLRERLNQLLGPTKADSPRSARKSPRKRASSNRNKKSDER